LSAGHNHEPHKTGGTDQGIVSSEFESVSSLSGA